MEDRYCALIKRKETFTKIVDSAMKISKTATGDIKDEGLMLVEYIKEYYMNYPLRNQGTTVTSSVFDELEFYSLQEDTIKNFHRGLKPYPRRRSISNGPLTGEKTLEPQKKSLSNLSEVKPTEGTEPEPASNGESGSAHFYEMLKKSSPAVMQLITGNVEKEKVAESPKVVSSPVKEAEQYALWKAKTTHLAYGSEAIISIIQSPYLTSRIIVRDLTGKHAWLITEHRVLDYNCLDTIDYNDKAAVYKNVLNLKGDQSLKDMITENKWTPEAVKAKEEKEKKEIAQKLEQEFKAISEDPAKMQEELKKIEESDTLARVISLFSKHCADAKIFKDLLNSWEKQEISQNEKEISEFEAKAIKMEESEQALYKVAEIEHKSKCDEEFKADVKLLNKMYQSDQPRIDYARSFLSHLGDLDILPSASNAVPSSTLPKLTLLNESDSDFRMLMKFLDTECVLRRSIKLGVIYVERGQFDQKSILYNTKGSAKYEELLSSLGKSVSKKENKSLSLQPEVLYYATAIYELVFHVITMMTTNFNDSQQLEKKKYVGNDSVHIVWSENDREYKAGTITGSFNFAHIIVYPMRNGLYKIQISRKKDNEKKKELVKFFGPLITGMVLPMEILPSLLRYTAINARKSITFKQLQMFNPMTERRKTIEKIVSKFAMQSRNKNDQQFMLIDRLMHSSSK